MAGRQQGQLHELLHRRPRGRKLDRRIRRRLMRHTGMSRPTMYRHLRALVRAGARGAGRPGSLAGAAAQGPHGE
ncbi:MAG: ArsR family transcriptional regulator [Streptosporangiales bacterium]|nr:ArsR family transcriptional regulator [Streptosporangiales bacterium]